MIRMTDLLAKAAFNWPDHPAFTCGLRTLTWAELNTRTRQLATSLHGFGVQRGDRVGFLGFNSHVGAECYYAPALIGACVVPLNFRLAAGEMVQLLNNCRPHVLIVDEEHAEIAAQVIPHCPSIQKVLYAGTGPVPQGMLDYEETLSSAGTEPDFDTLAGSDDDTLIMFYTGGTTGTPKGVMLTHSNIYANAMGMMINWNIGQNETHFMSGPMFHTAGGSRVYATTLMGTHLITMPKFDVGGLLHLIQHHRVNLVQFVPTMMVMILDHPDFGKYDLSSLKMMTYGASPMPPELMKRAIAAFPGVGFGQAFGMTEASPILTILNPEYHVVDGPNAGRLNSLGKPLPFVDLRVVDEDDNPLPPGQVGEIIARGPNIMKGYWEQPEMTAEVMRGGFYHTGDGGYYDEQGFLFLAGRIKDMIITGGENVYPIEVEDVVSTHPCCKQVAVIGTPDPQWGERVHAVIELNPGTTATAQEIRELCRARLAHYKCPTLVSFRTEPLPLTKVNKIDKRALRDEYNGKTPT
ncbi:Acyl-CoA synthetase (AMP-forming)/AMP-acid ligase II [Thalassovita litoralis]|jgi:acyl-CoA synthetase (AMP-forming)/AMP-acid ligase II|uniref:3-methylmercaptopropionyl-CoA ligase n=1 Tax=Thalassovita litoralis TaxID=1010611 RepID=A0A521ENL3_9RHOB|nr:long-chain-fatty-acid--CoA ligase [Thalassovita litoralis]SMO85498.1 Acyl-CoA synthetase (AMP-forming)/AMP-acid ligase II [Thalassovita litoralis]